MSISNPIYKGKKYNKKILVIHTHNTQQYILQRLQKKEKKQQKSVWNKSLQKLGIILCLIAFIFLPSLIHL